MGCNREKSNISIAILVHILGAPILFLPTLPFIALWIWKEKGVKYTKFRGLFLGLEKRGRERERERKREIEREKDKERERESLILWLEKRGRKINRSLRI